MTFRDKRSVLISYVDSDKPVLYMWRKNKLHLLLVSFKDRPMPLFDTLLLVFNPGSRIQRKSMHGYP